MLLYHHIQGLTDGVRAFAEDLRRAGHTVHTPDLFDGRAFSTIAEGFAFAEEAGIEELRVRGAAAADGLSPDLVYPGDRHLFTDSSLEAFDEDASALVRERVHAFLAGL